MTYKDNTPTYNVNRKVANFGDFTSNIEAEKENLKKVKRSFQPNSDRQNFPSDTRNEFDPITRKITAFTEDEVDDRIKSVEELEEANEKKSEKSESIEECPSFSEFNKSISDLKKVTKKIHSELKRGTKGEIDDYIEKKIFGRDV
jgi:protein-tyrosine phosphatase